MLYTLVSMKQFLSFFKIVVCIFFLHKIPISDFFKKKLFLTFFVI